MGVLQRMRALSPRDIVVCSVVKAELFYGAMRSTDPVKALVRQRQFLDQFVSLPFDDRSAEEYGRIRAYLAQQGMLIGPNDLLIAAVALSYRVILVTHNTREFSRVPGLLQVDWETTS